MQQAIGIVGAGTITDAFHIPALKKCGFHAIYIHDIDEKRVAEVAYRHAVKTASFDFIVGNCDNMIIATPPGSHYTLLRQAAGKGKTVICEKPFVAEYKQAIELHELYRSTGGTLLVAHLRRLFPAIALAKELITRQHPGKLLKADLFEGMRFNYHAHSGYAAKDPLGGVLLDTGSHVLDCFLYVTGLETGELQSDVIAIKKDRQEPSHEYEASFTLKRDHENIPVSVRLSRYRPMANKMNLYFEGGILEVPLGLKPFVRFTSSTSSEVISGNKPAMRYMSEAFREEFTQLLVNRNTALFSAGNFMNLTMLLEQLNNHPC